MSLKRLKYTPLNANINSFLYVAQNDKGFFFLNKKIGEK